MKNESNMQNLQNKSTISSCKLRSVAFQIEVKMKLREETREEDTEKGDKSQIATLAKAGLSTASIKMYTISTFHFTAK